MELNWKKLGISFILSSTLLLTACQTSSDSEETLVNGDEIDLAYVTWDTEIASTHVVGTVLEDLGYDVTLTALDNAIMWQSLATGETDAMVSAWLPETHGPQLDEYGDQVDHLGVNLEGGKIGYVVPTYMEVDSVEELTTEADQTIVGIEAGSGTVANAQEVAEHYPNLEDWEVQASSSGAMATELGTAIRDEEEIVVTGWTPHWKFENYDLKFLEEPENIFGEEETIETFARQGFEEEDPVAYSVLENFYWELDDIQSVMLDINGGADAEDAARTWVDENQDKVAEWISDAENIAQNNE